MRRGTDRAILARVAKAMDERYWRKLREGIGESAPEVALSRGQMAVAEGKLDEEGWFSVGNAISARNAASLVALVEKLRAGAWLPVYAFLYDELWTLARHPRLLTFFERVFDGEVCQRRYFWSHFISPRAGARGWAPHFDGESVASGSLQETTVSLWIPLTGATLENGCMYLIPSAAGGSGAAGILRRKCSPEEVSGLLHRARAVPAPARSLLAWRGDIVHWGSFARESRGGEPRISIALEYQARRATPRASRLWTKDEPILPSFEERLRLVTEQVIHYHQRFEKHDLSPAQLMIARILQGHLDHSTAARYPRDAQRSRSRSKEAHDSR